MRKTSVYLDDEQADRLARLARAEGCPPGGDRPRGDV
jgi:predicted transcriptional regulator